MLHKSDFLEISLLPGINGILIKWLPDSERMTEVQFKEQIEAEQAAILKMQPLVVLADTLNMHFSISEELKQWHNQLMLPAFEKVGLKKLAVLVSHDFFTQISVEKLLEEDYELIRLTNYFDNEEAAYAWLKK